MFQEYLRYKNVSTNIRKNENKASIKNILNITSKFYHEQTELALSKKLINNFASI